MKKTIEILEKNIEQKDALLNQSAQLDRMATLIKAEAAIKKATES